MSRPPAPAGDGAHAVPTFEYVAIDAAGTRVTGALAGASTQAVLSELENRSLVPVRVREQAQRRGLTLAVSARRLGASYQQLGDLLRAGVPVARSLALLARARGSRPLASAYRSIGEAVAEGSDLADAMAARPEVFASVHVAMVRAGEKGGFLEQVFDRMARFVLGQAELRSKVIGALIYPAFLVGAGVVILSVIFGVFVPKFRSQFDRLDQLPAVTSVVLAVSDSVTRHGLVTLIVLAAVGFVAWRWARRPASRRTLDAARLRAPVFGPIARSLAVARFCRMLGTMEGNGVPLLAALQIAKDAAGNALLEDAIDRASESVRAGEPLAEPLRRSGLFDEDVVEMIAVGEAAGNVDEVLLRTADTLEARVDRLLAVAVRLIEPVVLAAIALVIGLVAAGLILPMVRLSETVS